MSEQVDIASRPPTVLLGVTGCIAAYKSCEVVRALQKAGFRVKVVMTHHAARFVGATTFKALTHEPVAVELFDEPGDPIHHISLAQEAAVCAIVPATANVIAKLSAGIADDLLTTTVLATQSPIVIAPAMNVHMYENARFATALRSLRESGAHIVEPESGYLACGDVGEGRLASVDTIVQAILACLPRSGKLAGKRVLVTAGGTREPIDPVRFIGNRSSGKTGYAIAEAAYRQGADVTLIAGPTSLPDPFGVNMVHVERAQEMFEAALDAFSGSDLAVFSAAVADFKPAITYDEKVKKSTRGQVGDNGSTGFANGWEIPLVRNPDILETLARVKGDTFVVGFAAETQNVLDNAREKLVRKGADLIVANDVSNPSRGFGSSDNRVWFVDADGVRDLGVLSKQAIAESILEAYRDTMEHA